MKGKSGHERDYLRILAAAVAPKSPHTSWTAGA